MLLRDHRMAMITVPLPHLGKVIGANIEKISIQLSMLLNFWQTDTKMTLRFWELDCSMNLEGPQLRQHWKTTTLKLTIELEKMGIRSYWAVHLWSQSRITIIGQILHLLPYIRDSSMSGISICCGASRSGQLIDLSTRAFHWSEMTSMLGPETGCTSVSGQWELISQ